MACCYLVFYRLVFGLLSLGLLPFDLRADILARLSDAPLILEAGSGIGADASLTNIVVILVVVMAAATAIKKTTQRRTVEKCMILIS